MNHIYASETILNILKLLSYRAVKSKFVFHHYYVAIPRQAALMQSHFRILYEINLLVYIIARRSNMGTLALLQQRYSRMTV